MIISTFIIASVTALNNPIPLDRYADASTTPVKIIAGHHNNHVTSVQNPGPANSKVLDFITEKL